MVVNEQTATKRPTQIPVSRNTRARINSATSEDNMAFQDGGVWRQRYEQTEVKRKETLSHLLKAMREKDEIEKNLVRESCQVTKLRNELDSQKQQAKQLRTLSEAMVKEYDELKHKYELETGALHQAMQRATQWYKENKELKRRSAVLASKVLTGANIDQTDYDGNDQDKQVDTDAEIDLLNHQINNLRSQLAGLQAEINALKLEEFEAQEQVADLTSCLEEERNKNRLLAQQLQEEKARNSNLEDATRLAAQQVSALRDQCQKEQQQSNQFKSDANQARKERNVLAHQSQILLCDAAQDEKLMNALMEIEKLKTQLEEEQIKSQDLLFKYQEKLCMEEEPAQVELLEQKLKLVESELNISEDKALRAEQEIQQLNSKIAELEERLSSKLVPPPPPPPPPPPCFPTTSSTAPLTLKTNKTNSVVEMANLLGVTRATKPALQQGAIEELINEIKGGKFLLRTPERQKKAEKTEEQPPALKEMMNVLGTLRRRPGNRVPSFKRTKTPEMKQCTQDITI